MVFELNSKIAFNKCLNYVIFYIKLNNTFKIQLSCLITAACLLFIELKFTTNVTMFFVSVNTRVDIFDHRLHPPFQSSRDDFKWLVRYKKREVKASLHFHLELNALEGLRPLTDTNLKHKGREQWVLCPKNSLLRYR